MSESQAEPTAEQLVEELRKAKVDDLLLHTCSLLASLGFGKLDVGDLPQARLAIDAVKALEPLLAEDARRDVANVVANLQLAYADAAKGGGEPEG